MASMDESVVAAVDEFPVSRCANSHMEKTFINEYTKIAAAASGGQRDLPQRRPSAGRCEPSLDLSAGSDYIFTNKYNFY